MKLFTKEEKSLCKQIAERHRKEIGKGDWYLDIDLTLLSTSDAWVGQKLSPDLIPIWTISDCLEFLREKYFFESMLLQLIWDGWNYVISKKPTQKEPSFQFSGITLLEACLKAVSAVLKEKK